MGGKSSAPPAPDPTITSAAQTQSNKDTAAYNAALNRMNSFSPFGSSTWTQTGVDPKTGAPIYAQQTSLNPMLQSSVNSAEQQAMQTFATPFDPTAQRDAATAAIYGRETGMLDPQYQQQKTQLDSQLAQQGITQGSEGWNNAQNNFARQRDYAYSQARDQAIAGGQQEVQTDLALRNQPLFALGQLRGIVSNPTGGPAISAGSTDVSGNIWNAYNGNLSATSANNANANATNSELASAAMMALMYFSDRRLKKNVEFVGIGENGLPVHEYHFAEEADDAPKHRGYIADEVRQVFPEAVARDAAGFDLVNYGALHGIR